MSQIQSPLLLRLRESGNDVEAALARFAGKEALYEKFLLKFPADESYAEFVKSMEAGDTKEAVRFAHTLKGITANLGLSELYEASSEMVRILRAEESGKIEGARRTLEEKYNEAVAWLA